MRNDYGRVVEKTDPAAPAGRDPNFPHTVRIHFAQIDLIPANEINSSWVKWIRTVWEVT